MTSTSNAKKRPAPSSSTDQGASKIKKVHPFFSKTQEPQTETTSTSKFKWQKPLGARASCLYGINLEPSPSAKVAAFDLDGTLIKSSFGKGNGKGKGKGVVSAPAQFEWWRPSIPAKLREVHAQGFSVVIISNQALKPAAIKTWKEKVEAFAAALPDLPFYLFAATAKDEYRKPMPGMWNALVDIFSEGGVSIDIQNSFFVGDAAGRRYGKKDKDFACTDRKWALNVGLPFHTPEEYFLGLAVHTDYVLDGFDVSTVPSLPLFSNTSSPVVKEGKGKGKGKEMVLFVGYPCLGKTSLYHRYFKPAGYVHVNQDELGSRAKCLVAAKAALEEGRSCVIDNTNRDVKTRAYYVDLAEKLGVSTRCFLFTGSVELAWHNNLYRALNCPSGGARRELLPYLAFSGFKASYEAPSVEEGFEEVKEVNWVFEGSEEARRCWSMWLQI